MAYHGNRPDHGLRSFLSQPVIASFVAGGVAGAVSRTVVSPFEILKIRLQLHDKASKNPTASITRMFSETGLKGLFAGNGVNCARILPYSAVNSGSYNIRQGWSRARPQY